MAKWDAKAEPVDGDRLHARARADAGLHRRARDRRPRRDARRHGRHWAATPPRSTRCSPAELVIDHSVQVDEFGTHARLQAQRRARVRAQPRALRVPALGPDGVRQLPRGAARHRHLPPGQPRVPGARRLRRSDGQALPRHARRHRLAHHDDQRPGRAGLGRGRHRGRGRDARPAGLDADAAGGRLQADRRAARGRDRHRPGAHRHPDAAREGRGRQVRRVLRRRAWPTCRWPTAPRSATWRPSTAPPAASSRSTPRRSATSVHRPPARARSRWSRPTPRSRGCSTTRAPRRRRTRDTLELDLGDGRASARRPEAPAGPRAAARGAARRSARRSSSDLGDERPRPTPCTTRRGVGRVVPGQRPADVQRRRGRRRRDTDGAGAATAVADESRGVPVKLPDGRSSSSTTARW